MTSPPKTPPSSLRADAARLPMVLTLNLLTCSATRTGRRRRVYDECASNATSTVRRAGRAAALLTAASVRGDADHVTLGVCEHAEADARHVLHRLDRASAESFGMRERGLDIVDS